MKVFRHKGFIGSIEANLEGKCLYGKLLYINDLITYEAQTVAALEKEFRKAIVDYLQTCEELDREPMKPFKGSLNVRIGSELHKLAALHAASQGITINEFIKNSVQNQILRESEKH